MLGRNMLLGVLVVALLGACGGDAPAAAAEAPGGPAEACPASGGVLTWRLEGREPIVGAGAGFVVGDSVLVRGERPDQTGWYDVATEVWRPLPDSTPILGGSAMALDTRVAGQPRLLSMGGSRGKETHEAAFLALDASRGVWQTGTSMPEGRQGASVCLDGDSVLVLGGCWSVKSGASSLVYRYDLREGMTGQWTELDTLPEPRTRAAALVVGRRVFLVGGDLGNFGNSPAALATSTLVFDLDERSWRTLPGLLTPRRLSALVWLCGRVVAVGGELGDASPTAAVEAFDPVTETWTAWPDLPEPRSALGLVEHRGQLLSVASSTIFSEPPGRLVSTWSLRP